MTADLVILEQTISSITNGLLERLRSRDDAAWSRLVCLYAPLVDEWCRQLQPADIENVCQEVFFAAHRAILSFRRDSPQHSFCGWLRRITENKIRDHWRRVAATGQGEGGTDALEGLHQVADERVPPEEDEPLTPAETKLVYARIMEFVKAEFHERTWQAFHEVVVVNRPPADVAADLGMSVNAVHLAKGRVLRRIREWTEEHQNPGKAGLSVRHE